CAPGTGTRAEGPRGATDAQPWVPAMPEADRMKATIAFEDLTRALVCIRHYPFNPLGLLLGVDDAHSQPGVVDDGQYCVVSDLRLLVFGHLAVVAGRFGSLALFWLSM